MALNSFSLVSVIILFLRERVISPLPNPQPGGPVGSLFVWPLLFEMFGMGVLAGQEYKTPDNITLGVTGARKQPHHDKVAIPIEALLCATRHKEDR